LSGMSRRRALPEDGVEAAVKGRDEKEGPSTDFSVIWGRLVKVGFLFLFRVFFSFFSLTSGCAKCGRKWGGE